MLRTLRAALLALLTAGVLSVSGAAAAPGDLDPSFGTGGIVSTDLGAGGTRLQALVRQPDGKLVAAGGAWFGYVQGDIALVRLTDAGALDPTFGVNGLVTTDLGGSEMAWALALQVNGKLVVAARSYVAGADRLYLVRYLPDGTLDPAFGTGGIVATPIDGSAGLPYGLAVQPDGRIVAAGSRGPSGVDVVRYTAAGAPDSEFGTNGTVATPFGGVSGYASWYGVAVQPDRRIVVKANSGYGVELVRLTPNGTLDPMFGSGGHAQIPVPLTSTGMLLQPNGKIVMAGLSTCGDSCDFGLVRLGTYGWLDTTFGTNGFVTTDLGAQEFAYGLARQPDGKLVAVGGRRLVSAPPTDSDFVVARYLKTGELDTAFGGGDGVVLTDIAGDDTATAVALQPDGKVVAAGDGFASSPYPPTRFVLVRYAG